MFTFQFSIVYKASDLGAAMKFYNRLRWWLMHVPFFAPKMWATSGCELLDGKNSRTGIIVVDKESFRGP